MPDMPREMLLFAENADILPAHLGALRRAVQVTQVMPPRLALVIAPEGSEPPPIPGVVYLTDDTPPPADLSPDERLFVEGWRLRRQPKERPGEGLSWDSPGFEPPDGPTAER